MKRHFTYNLITVRISFIKLLAKWQIVNYIGFKRALGITKQVTLWKMSVHATAVFCVSCFVLGVKFITGVSTQNFAKYFWRWFKHSSSNNVMVQFYGHALNLIPRWRNQFIFCDNRILSQQNLVCTNRSILQPSETMFEIYLNIL